MNTVTSVRATRPARSISCPVSASAATMACTCPPIRSTSIISPASRSATIPVAGSATRSIRPPSSSVTPKTAAPSLTTTSDFAPQPRAISASPLAPPSFASAATDATSTCTPLAGFAPRSTATRRRASSCATGAAASKASSRMWIRAIVLLRVLVRYSADKRQEPCHLSRMTKKNMQNALNLRSRQPFCRPATGWTQDF
jgi:hypothetical protein